LQKEQFFKDEALVCRCPESFQGRKFFFYWRKVHAVKRSAAIEQIQPAAQRRRQAVRNLRREIFQRSMYGSPKPPRSKFAIRSRSVNGNNAANLQRFNDRGSLGIKLFSFHLVQNFKLWLGNLQPA